MSDTDHIRCRGMRRACVAITVASCGLGVAAYAETPAVNKPAADVTITVVEDADQLKEVVNTIKLPTSNEEKAETAAERAREQRQAAEKGKSDASDSAKDAHDAHQDTRDAAENQKDPD